MDLQSNDSVVSMLRLMEENGRPEQAREMRRMIACADSTEEQYGAVLQELSGMEGQLARGLEDQAAVIQKQFKTVRDKVVSCAEKAVSGFQEAGVSALDTAVCALDIKDALDFVQDKFCGALVDTRAPIHVRAKYADMIRTVYGALGAADRLEFAAKRSLGKSKWISVRRRLEEKKAKAPDRASPASARKPREVSR